MIRREKMNVPMWMFLPVLIFGVGMVWVLSFAGTGNFAAVGPLVPLGAVAYDSIRAEMRKRA